MRPRSFIGILAGLAAVVAASYLTHQNRDLLHEPVRLGGDRTVPLWLVVLFVFLVGLLPTLTALLVSSVKRDLALREERRQAREAESLDRSFHRAVDFQADGQWERAAAELEAVLTGRPEDFETLLRYGEMLRRLGRVDEALDIHRRASASFPRSVAVLYQLAEDYEVRGETEVASEIRNRVLREFPTLGLDILRRRRNTALGARQWLEAADYQARIDGLIGNDELPPAGPALVEAQYEIGVRRGLEYQRGLVALEDERIDEAVATFQGLLEQERRFIPAAILLGEAELVRDQPEAAIEVWMRGYRETGSPIFWLRIEDHLIENAEPRRAIETLRRLVAEADHDLLLRFFLGRLYYRLEMHDDALKALEGLREELAPSPTYHFLMARIRQRRGEGSAALAEFESCARCLGLPGAQFRCRVCNASHDEWQDRCDACGSWNSVELRIEDVLEPEELGLRDSPIWIIPPQWVPEVGVLEDGRAEAEEPAE
jgi:lipopolysaccharide biosynthesis regulator YciM